MRPLQKSELSSFLKRFDNFKDAELRSIEIYDASTISVVLAAQDSTREYDWITIELEFTTVTDAKLLQNKQLSLLDMQYGISLIESENIFAFAPSECYNIANIKHSSCYVLAKSLKYQEGLF